MYNRITQILQGKTARHYVRVVTFAVLGMLIGALILSYAKTVFAPKNFFTGDEASFSDGGFALSTTSPFSRSAPVSLRIPTIHLDVEFEAPLGLNDDKTVEVPDSFEKVGWYKYGPTPGEVGPAVILGHVDSFEGPAVFYSLGQLSPGDKIFVTRADGTEATFEVMNFERYSIEEFPTEKVYGPVNYPALRLITCTGTYDKGERRYSHNLVVYAKLIEPSHEGDTPE